MTTVDEREKMDMNYEYTYDEELKLSADMDMFDEFRFRTGVEDGLYEAEAERIVLENPAIS